MKKLKDDLLYTDEKTGEQVVFNHYSFCELIKWIIVRYASKTYKDANELVNKSVLVNEPESYLSVTLITHELEYHWAMIVAHGDMYWQRGIPSDFKKFSDEYSEWEKEIIKSYNLKEPYIYLDN
ncbi:hypothetical protein M2451_002491 [Dysgonomonas sp. PFB1-18]|uniref:hypothetical protein n=1 Tax=unclassified Dysgonomonas TaxID=2630389 RepID=UPI00247487F6|nr:MULTISPECIES: hypothetical protein [unclassified Dysgonomonas]MDH6307972.1 hypothetical protein [Dysgonomonas sp. PF1-14]MDH6339511.1 hypothetical protein [Dysgonomonas sp. PF1-16]MDH6381162.1 hypothetical protein [Dysgonomonas sp. PFB1-18]MDH6398374.1 hypothetical protein [Dysgonomonas sp. PF1-23]